VITLATEAVAMVQCPTDEPVEWDYEADVLVVGFGGAGGCAAVAAHDAGADVLVVEKQAEASYVSNTRMSTGGFHSPDPSGDTAALREYALAMFSGHNLDWKLEGEQPAAIAGALADHWADLAPENLSWLRELDPEFDAVDVRGASFTEFPGAEASGYRVLRSTYTGEVTRPNTSQADAPKAEKECGEAFYTCIRTGVEDRDVDVHWGTAAEEFVVEDGDVTGLIAERDGDRVAYGADATVLTTGGFEFDADLRMQFLEGPGVEGWAFYGSPANTGDGIGMSMEVGAGLSKVGKAACRMVAAIPVREHGLKVGLKTPVLGRPHAIVVDSFGERYAAERTITEDPTRYLFYKEGVRFDIERLVYPRIPSWLVFDESIRRTRPVVDLRPAGYHGIEWGERNEAALEEGWILQSDSVEGLAERIRDHPDGRGLMDPETLATTVEGYNDHCERGDPGPLGGDPENMGAVSNPPYYALPQYPGGPNTKGGVMADGERRVLDRDGDPVGNLYSAGEISSAFKFVYQGGGNLAECIVFGRVAGENAARRAERGG
jgi:succinate dehydrogenase/fumarate reductase flavoprotein subunit